METHKQATPMRDIVLRAIAVLGLIAVLLLGAWGIIQLAVAVPTLFSNAGNGLFSGGAQKESLVVSSGANITSGQTLQVSWDHKNKNGEYSYSISYACQNGLSLKAPLPTGAYQTITCNTPFNFVNANDHMTVIPAVSGKTALPLAMTVIATNLSSGAVTAQGTATTNVAPAVATTPAKPSTSNNSSTYVAAPARQPLFGYGDLAIAINSVTPGSNGLTSVKFTVTNIGTNSVNGGWVFNANLPINGSYVFMSQPQRALFPGDKIVYTLTYSNSYNNYQYDPNGYGYTGNGSYLYPPQPSYNYGYSGPVTITVDPQNAVWESNESNNTAYAQGY